jgi:hypothetical protein
VFSMLLNNHTSRKNDSVASNTHPQVFYGCMACVVVLPCVCTYICGVPCNVCGWVHMHACCVVGCSIFISLCYAVLVLCV